MAKQSIQYISDIHLEFYEEKHVEFSKFVIPVSENIALLGDIGYPTDENYYNFISDCSNAFKKVFVVSGNHEYYTNPENSVTMVDMDKIIQSICKTFTNVYFLNNSEHILDDSTIILGTTLWSKIAENEMDSIALSINDYIKIRMRGRNITPNDINMIFSSNVSWLVSKLSQHSDKRIIILTHHSPSYKSIHQKYKGYPFNSAFASDLSYIFETHPNIMFWLFGHTHCTVEFVENFSKCATNPAGYIKKKDGNLDLENSMYSTSKKIEF